MPIVDFHSRTKPLHNLEDVDTHVRERNAAFLGQLSAFGMRVQLGYEIIRGKDRRVVKERGLYLKHPRQVIGTFTGENLCAVSSRALRLGLIAVTGNPELEYTIGELNCDMHGESWEDPDFVLKPITHEIVIAKDHGSDETRYYDATYAQVNHRYAGQIVIATPDDLDRLYRTGNKTSPVYEQIIPQIYTQHANPPIGNPRQYAQSFANMVATLL